MFHVYQLFSTSALSFDSVIVFYFNNHFYRLNHQPALLIFICIEHFFNLSNKYFTHNFIVFHYKIAYSTPLLFCIINFIIWNVYFYIWIFVKYDKKEHLVLHILQKQMLIILSQIFSSRNLVQFHISSYAATKLWYWSPILPQQHYGCRDIFLKASQGAHFQVNGKFFYHNIK